MKKKYKEDDEDFIDEEEVEEDEEEKAEREIKKEKSSIKKNEKELGLQEHLDIIEGNLIRVLELIRILRTRV